jgi:hypothetical protein
MKLTQTNKIVITIVLIIVGVGILYFLMKGTYCEDYLDKTYCPMCYKCPVCETFSNSKTYTEKYTEDEKYETDYTKYENSDPLKLDIKKPYKLSELIKKGSILLRKSNYLNRQLMNLFSDRQEIQKYSELVGNKIMKFVTQFYNELSSSKPNIKKILKSINDSIEELNGILKNSNSKESLIEILKVK